MKKFISILLTAILFELMLGGGGRLTAWGPISLRMILFALAIFTIAIQILRKQKIPNEYLLLMIVFGILLSIGLARGVALGATRFHWWEDVKPLMYFFILPFFGFAIQEYSKVERIGRIIKISGIILSCLFILTLILIHTSVEFLDFYTSVIGTEEFFFRGELTFFYKGFVYISIAFLFVHFSESQYKYLILILLGLAILLSVTRGFLFALALVYALYHLMRSSFIKSVIFGVLALVIIFFGQYAITFISKSIDQVTKLYWHSQPIGAVLNSNLLGNRDYSDDGRFKQIREVVSQTNFSSVFIGHGFGNGIPSRPIHMEISYLEIFHKQGLVGIAFWAYLLLLLYQKYKLAPQSGLRDSFFFGSLFIFFQSLTNQYINNPIGLSMILVSIVCLDQLKPKHFIKVD
jgi:hypothetical protein